MGARPATVWSPTRSIVLLSFAGGPDQVDTWPGLFAYAYVCIAWASYPRLAGRRLEILDELPGSIEPVPQQSVGPIQHLGLAGGALARVQGIDDEDRR